MASITPSLRPMHYTGGQTISWSASSDIQSIASTINTTPPAISKYIAYDDLTPPNPFIAVTQDGNGNVVYDGGFPKFYNGSAPDTSVTSFSGLTAPHKYLYNALNYVANSAKVAAGNRQVLLIGDALATESYGVKSTATNGFRTCMERICAVANYPLTIKDRADWGGVINPTLAELDQYCLVIIMGTMGGATRDNITAQAVNDIVTYRAQGSGLILITDHGPDLVSLEDAATSTAGGFFDMLNRIAVNFGAYFTGDYARTPVNVGFLRSTYGDHPLYNGMTDSEDIAAGGSESKVVVTEVPTFAPTAIPSSVLDTTGRHTVNFLAILTDGNAQTFRFTYTIIEGAFAFFQTADQTTLESYIWPTYRNLMDLELTVTDPNVGTIQGTLLRNDLPVGTFSHDSNGTVYRWYAGEDNGAVVDDGDRLGLLLDTPFDYYAETTVSKVTPNLPSPVNMAYWLRQCRQQDLAGLSPRGVLTELTRYVQARYDAQVLSPTYPSRVRPIAQALSDPSLAEITVPVYPDEATLMGNVGGLSPSYPAAINAATGDVYRKEEYLWQVIDGLHPSHYLGSPRVVRHLDGTRYQVPTSGALTAV